MGDVMPDDDDKKAFEEARREFEDDPSPQESKRPKDASAPETPGQENGKGTPSLRVVPYAPRADAWAAPSWVPTGEAVMLEAKKKWGEDFYHVPLEGITNHWNGGKWEIDRANELMRLCSQLCREIGAVKTKKTVRKMLEGAQFIHGVATRLREERSGPFDVFDAADLLWTPIETWPLTLPLEPREHRREDYCTRGTAVAAIKGPCPIWLDFLAKITGNDNDLRDYLQRCAGYWATPFTGEQAFWFLYGSGGNGKGAFLRTIKRCLGEYATTASLDLFLATKFEQHSEELASLRGIRLVFATETEKGRSWNEGKIKALTGGDAIRARFMRQNSFEYDPKFKIVVSGNHKPRIKSVDAAMRRRLNLVPFEVEIPKAEQDESFETRMFEAEGPQILWWILEGFKQWREFGLAPPDKVIEASEEYFTEQDEKGQWMEERCDVGDMQDFGYSVSLYQDWKKWAEARGIDQRTIGSQTAFSIDLGKRLHQKPDHTNKGNGFWGIKLKPVEDDYQ